MKESTDERIQRIGARISGLSISRRASDQRRTEFESRLAAFPLTLANAREAGSGRAAALRRLEQRPQREAPFLAGGLDFSSLSELLHGAGRGSARDVESLRERETRTLRVVEEKLKGLETFCEKVKETLKEEAQGVGAIDMGDKEGDTGRYCESIENTERESLEGRYSRESSRESSDLANKIEEVVETFKKELAVERKLREDSEGAVYEMFREVVDKLREEIVKETASRETVEADIRALLSGISAKISAVPRASNV